MDSARNKYMVWEKSVARTKALNGAMHWRPSVTSMRGLAYRKRTPRIPSSETGGAILCDVIVDLLGAHPLKGIAGIGAARDLLNVARNFLRVTGRVCLWQDKWVTIWTPSRRGSEIWQPQDAHPCSHTPTESIPQ